jgi:hypothetical protein
MLLAMTAFLQTNNALGGDVSVGFLGFLLVMGFPSVHITLLF